jgi:hypothetical protein
MIPAGAMTPPPQRQWRSDGPRPCLAGSDGQRPAALEHMTAPPVGPHDAHWGRRGTRPLWRSNGFDATKNCGSSNLPSFGVSSWPARRIELQC